MATVGDLRSQLSANGYTQYGDGATIVDGSIVFTLHRHPLFNQVLVLSGNNTEAAREYQDALVEAAIKPR